MTRRMPRQTEAQFQQAVLEYAAVFGWHWQYHTFDSRRSTGGFPDLVLMRPPQLLVVELKSGTKTTAAQDGWLEAFRQCGVTALVWTPDDWPEIEQALDRKSKMGAMA